MTTLLLPVHNVTEQPCSLRPLVACLTVVVVVHNVTEQPCSLTQGRERNLVESGGRALTR